MYICTLENYNCLSIIIIKKTLIHGTYFEPS